MKSDKQSKLNFESMIEHGEPDFFTAQTPNGTAHWQGTGWNRGFDMVIRPPQLKPAPTWRAGRSNRTGE